MTNDIIERLKTSGTELELYSLGEDDDAGHYTGKIIEFDKENKIVVFQTFKVLYFPLSSVKYFREVN